ncbi:hypothetical protein PAPYR_11401 [Paratrimastix pyriformis]|uniref:Uncharacterized protein n=1 Tax=Paratrimastix pyriformis TaxID=342808 RepID=A0ABQ8U3S5_9EUKA|nr:hypothetical protein PAPYR_11401 [Paratrimastix pyriformis]
MSLDILPSDVMVVILNVRCPPIGFSPTVNCFAKSSNPGTNYPCRLSPRCSKSGKLDHTLERGIGTPTRGLVCRVEVSEHFLRWDPPLPVFWSDVTPGRYPPDKSCGFGKNEWAAQFRAYLLRSIERSNIDSSVCGYLLPDGEAMTCQMSTADNRVFKKPAEIP